MEPHFTVTFCRTLVEKSRTGWTPLDCDCVAWRYGRSYTYHRVRPLNSCHRKEIGDVEVIACMAVLATIWVTPWDNLMLFEGVWTYPPALVHTTYACRGYDAWRTGPSPASTVAPRLRHSESLSQPVSTLSEHPTLAKPMTRTDKLSTLFIPVPCWKNAGYHPRNRESTN